MFARSARLSRLEFSNFFTKRDALRFHGQWQSVVFVPHELAKFSVVVSKKVSKRAVVRNKLRRRAYGTLANNVASIPTGVVIVLYKPGASKANRLILQTELVGLLARISKSR